jgi:hypothetical protein
MTAVHSSKDLTFKNPLLGDHHGRRFSDNITANLYDRNEDWLLEVRGKNAGGRILSAVG